MAALQPFCPSYKTGNKINVISASASASLTLNTLSVMITNYGANNAYIRTSDSKNAAISATINDFCVLPNSQVAITKTTYHDTISAITSGSGHTTLHAISGEGWR